VLIDIQRLLHARYIAPKGMYSGHVTTLYISGNNLNISKTVQDRDIVAMED